MNIEHLTVFVNLSETLNYSKTALQLHMSQSAVSQIISNMEKELNFKLFNRNRRSVSLTRAGLNFYQTTKSLLSSYNKVVQESQKIEQTRQYDLTVSYSGTPFELQFIPKIISSFLDIHPEMNVFLEDLNHADLVKNIETGECDVIFTMEDVVHNFSNITYQDLTNGPFELHFSKNQYLKEDLPDKIQVQNLSQYRIIMLDNKWCSPCQDQIQKFIKKKNHSLDLAFANNITTSNVMTRTGLGAGLWASFASDPKENDLFNIPIDYSPNPHYGIAYLKSRQTTPAYIFGKWLKNKFTKFEIN